MNDKTLNSNSILTRFIEGSRNQRTSQTNFNVQVVCFFERQIKLVNLILCRSVQKILVNLSQDNHLDSLSLTAYVCKYLLFSRITTSRSYYWRNRLRRKIHRCGIATNMSESTYIFGSFNPGISVVLMPDFEVVFEADVQKND